MATKTATDTNSIIDAFVHNVDETEFMAKLPQLDFEEIYRNAYYGERTVFKNGK